VTGVSLFFFYQKFYQTVWQQMSRRLQDVARTGSGFLTEEHLMAIERLRGEMQARSYDPDTIAPDLEPGDYADGLDETDIDRLQSSSDYQMLLQFLRRVKAGTGRSTVAQGDLTQHPLNDENPVLIRYAYILTEVPSHPDHTLLQFLADADYTAFDYNQNGEIDEAEEPTFIGTYYSAAEFPAMRRAFDGEIQADQMYQQDAWGVTLSAYAPIKNRSGEVIAIMGLDMRAENEYNMINDVFWLFIAIVVASGLFSITISMLIARLLTRPLSQLYQGAERVRNRDFSTRIQINSGDEIQALADVFNAMVHEINDYASDLKEQSESFMRFVPTQFLQSLGKPSAADIFVGDSRNVRMSILFTDIRSFTTLSEGLSPEDNLAFLNSYMQRMEPAIQSQKGFIDKFMGDAIMALFHNDTEQGITAADFSVRSAIEMRTQLGQYNQSRANAGYAPIDMGIGISTGDVILGTVGSFSRMDTTVLGNTVNLASRLEGLTTAYQLPVLICEDTFIDLTDADRYHIREVDTVIVKGRTRPALIYEVYDADPDNRRRAKDSTRDLLQKGIVQYKVRSFDAALTTFRQARQLDPEDRLLKLYVARCKKYMNAPPSEDWDGVVRLTRK
ncbi:MAG: HAMP domain-containing protein, partial [Leptospiraceae bacterium]|nr:HAMP domain-containing protein [Leptospiraceae bacterium]